MKSIKINHNSTAVQRALVICLLSVCISINSFAQSPIWKETFRQKRTQREYLAKQIALLHVYVDYVRDGYNIVSRGWTTLEHIRNGEVSLHRDFFSSLKNVNPHITNSVKVVDVVAFQVFIIKELRSVYTFCRNSGQFTPKEILYIYNVYSNMLFLTDANLSELIRITTSGETEMQDDERIKSIDALYEQSLDKIAFVKSFGGEARMLAAMRQHESFQNSLVGVQHALN